MTFTPKTISRLLSVPTALMLSTAIHAENTNRSLQIPAGQLSTALNQLAEASDLQMVYDTDMTQGLKSPALSGNYTPTQALQKLLQGSGLGYQLADNGTVTIVRQAPTVQPQSTQTAPEAAVLPTVRVKGQAEDDTAWATSPYNTDYNRPNATTATKTDTPIMETPVSLQVVPQQVLKDQQVIRLEDAYRNVSGVQPGFGNNTFWDEAYIRGFITNGTTFRNGFRQQYFAFETADLQQIDILKGPAAIMFGRVEPGGVINQITKKPLANPYYSLQQQFGSYGYYRTSVDATGPINADKSLRYRFNGAYTDATSFRDVGLERVFLAPSFSWQVTPDTEVNLSLNYQHQDTALDEGLPSQGNRPANVPLKTNYCDDECRLQHDMTAMYLSWSHHINDNWTIRNGFSGAWYQDSIKEFAHNSSVDAAGNFEQIPYLYEEDNSTYQTYFDVNGKFDVYGTQHNTLVGVDYYLRDFKQGFRGGYDVIQSRNIHDTRRDVFDFKAFAALGVNEFYPSQDEWFGVYFQDQITLWKNLHLLGGGRYDWATARAGFSEISSEAAALTATTSRYFSPRVGLLYQALSWLSVYGNYVESLGANNGGRSADGKPFQPQIGEQFEAGFKTAFFDGRLNATLAYFHLTKSNTLTPDLDNIGASKAIGEARSQGLEFDLSGNLTDRFSLIANYAYTDAVITKSNDDSSPELQVGASLPNVPEHAGSVWGKYSLIPERLEVGAGPYMASSRRGFGPNLVMPGYVRLDAYAAYHFNLGKQRLTTQVNINNLLDQDFFKTASSFGEGALPGDPLMVMGSLRLEY